MVNKSDLILTYVEERNRATIAVVEGESIEVFKAFINKWVDLGIMPPCFSVAPDKTLETTCRQMVIHETKAPESTKQKAREWLLSRGYDLLLD